jgi:hypothetical protein
LKVQKLKILREQDLGILEGKSYNARPRSDEKPRARLEGSPIEDQEAGEMESKESLDERLDEFVNDHLWKLAEEEKHNELIVAVVSHGIALSHLWSRILLRMTPAKITLAPGIFPIDKPVSIEHIGSWHNTGCLELELMLANTISKANDSTQKTFEVESSDGTSQPVKGSIHITAINSVIHLQGLKRTRGGVGSAAHDESQRKLESFFVKRPKLDSK